MKHFYRRGSFPPTPLATSLDELLGLDPAQYYNRHRLLWTLFSIVKEHHTTAKEHLLSGSLEAWLRSFGESDAADFVYMLSCGTTNPASLMSTTIYHALEYVPVPITADIRVARFLDYIATDSVRIRVELFLICFGHRLPGPRDEKEERIVSDFLLLHGILTRVSKKQLTLFLEDLRTAPQAPGAHLRIKRGFLRRDIWMSAETAKRLSTRIRGILDEL